jgi:hypothetical protein
MEVEKKNIIELPINTFRVYLDKLRIQLESPIKRKDVLHEISSGCHETARYVFNIVEYVSQFINDAEVSPYTDLDPRLFPYLPYFIMKDVVQITNNNPTLLLDPLNAIRPKPDATIDTFQRLIDFSRDYVVYLNFAPPRAVTGISHHFALYDGRICTAWGDDFNVYYVEKEITADNLMFLMKFEGSLSTDQSRFTELIGKYLLDIENFEYPSIYSTTYIEDPTPNKETKRLIVDKIIPIIAWIFELEDNRREIQFGNNDIHPYYEEINRLILQEWTTIRDVFLNRGVEITSVPSGPNEVLFEKEREELVPVKTNMYGAYRFDDQERKDILTELLESYGITPENDVDNDEEGFKNYENIIEQIGDLYVNGVQGNTHQLYYLVLNKHAIEERERALELYRIQTSRNLTRNELEELEQNAFYKRYKLTLAECASGQVVTALMYSNEPQSSLRSSYAQTYNQTVWNQMFDIINDFTMVRGMIPISRENPLRTPYGERLNQLLTKPMNTQYSTLMIDYDDNVDIIIQKLNESYREMGLFEPGDRPIVMPHDDDSCYKCIGSGCIKPMKKEGKPSKLKKKESPPTILPPVPPPPLMLPPVNQLVSDIPPTFSMGISSSLPRRPVTRSVTRSLSKSSKGGTRRRRTKQKRTKRIKRTKRMKRKNTRKHFP